MKFKHFFFTYVVRLSDLLLFSILAYWAIDAYGEGSRWGVIIFTAAAMVNLLSAYLSLRRDAVKYVFREFPRCSNCDDRNVLVMETTRFKFLDRAQCAIAVCGNCHHIMVYSCKCTPERCGHRIDCLSWDILRVPFFYPRVALKN